MNVRQLIALPFLLAENKRLRFTLWWRCVRVGRAMYRHEVSRAKEIAWLESSASQT
jgi:hypothetical protein